jgi:hypothetical protein
MKGLTGYVLPFCFKPEDQKLITNVKGSEFMGLAFFIKAENERKKKEAEAQAEEKDKQKPKNPSGRRTGKSQSKKPVRLTNGKSE